MYSYYILETNSLYGFHILENSTGGWLNDSAVHRPEK